MFFRSFITSGLIASLYTVMIAYMSGNQLPLGSSQMFIVLAIFWSMGFLSVIGYIYGRKIKRNFRVELLRIYTASGLASLGIFWFVERLF